MSSFRILNQFPVYLGRDNQPADNGWLAFYESGTTTPKSVYANPGLTIDNGATVTIGSDGRTEVDIWGDGSYRVRLYESDGTLLAEADDVEVAGGDAQTIPALVDGWFLTNNGALLLWEDIRPLLLPDPTGQDGKMLVADGDGSLWQAIPEPPEPPEPDIEVGANFLRIEDYYKQWGTGTGPATNTDFSSVAVSFPVPFDTAPHYVGVTVTTANINGTSLVAIGVTNIGASGFTVNFNNADRHYYNTSISSPVPFQWIAEGKKA